MLVRGHATHILVLIAGLCSIAIVGTYPSQSSGLVNVQRDSTINTQPLFDKTLESISQPQTQTLPSNLVEQDKSVSPIQEPEKALDIRRLPDEKLSKLALPQLAALTVSPTGRDANPASPEPFDMPAIVAAMGEIPSKWAELQTRIHADENIIAACLANDHVCTPAARRFLSIVELGRKHNARARLGWINRAVNLSVRPMSDWDQYGYADFWASPLQTLGSQAGDCEDYAIVKYVALRHLGMGRDNVRLIIVRDRTLQAVHAVVAARYEQKWIILDNRTLAMLDAEHVHYSPMFVMDEQGVREYSSKLAQR